MPIHFFSEGTNFNIDNTDFYVNWLNKVLKQYKKELGELNYIFCSDEYLLTVNRDHLNHDYYTDIITFDNSESQKQIEADIFISIDRVNENSNQLSVAFENELSRVMVHGLLHLIGYSDNTDDEKKVMREKEDACISLQEK